MLQTRSFVGSLVLLLLAPPMISEAAAADPLNPIAETWVKLVLAVGEHDPDYVDAYYGPEGWRKDAKARKTGLPELQTQADELSKDLQAVPRPNSEGIERHRYDSLSKHIQALRARIQMLRGRKYTFDEESLALYDTVAPHYPESYYDGILAEVDKLLPGTGPLPERFDAFQKEFIIPKEKLDAVFSAAIRECRKRTKAHVELPDNEAFTVEYVTNKPWGGYNWYQGNAKSVIQVNTDLPIYISRAIDLAAHEGYPGHHVYNVLLEKNLSRERGWVEFTVLALFSPQSLLAEGSANYGVEVVFPSPERLKFEQEVLFPLAGLDASRAERYYTIARKIKELAFADNDIARKYFAGEIERASTAALLRKYTLQSQERVAKHIEFIERYRSYIINYTAGEALVKQYIESRGGTAKDEWKRWSLFEALLSRPQVPSGLK